MKVGVPKEIAAGEQRVAATPETVKRLISSGFSVAVERGAGLGSAVLDRDFETAGAQIANDAAALFESAEIILKVRAPFPEEIRCLKAGTILISFLYPLLDFDLARDLAQKQITSFAMDMIPRIARAQKMDALSSQSNVAGYKSVLLAANVAGKFMPMLMTAAGTIHPARVFIIGAGVAGLQAVATARRLGARVEAFDTRPGVKDQVESLGAVFLSAALAGEETEDKQGYAKELSEESERRGLALIAKHAASSDMVITTALIPGKPAPRLITEETVKAMRPGSVIVDLAADFGGNCALTEPGKEVEKHGVRIIGYTNVPNLMAEEASRLYARNVMNFILDTFKAGGRELVLADEVVKDTLITRGGEIVHPRVRDSAAAGKNA